jgi:hypothetical protein
MGKYFTHQSGTSAATAHSENAAQNPSRAGGAAREASETSETSEAWAEAKLGERIITSASGLVMSAGCR